MNTKGAEIMGKIEKEVEAIARIIGPAYKISVVIRHCGKAPFPDADIILTQDTREGMMSVIDRHLPVK